MAINRLSQSTAQSAFPKFTNFWDGTTATSSFDSLGSVYLSSTASSITFSSIPQTYTHLQVRGISRNSANVSGDLVQYRLNSDSGSNYFSHWLVGSGAAGGAVTSSNPGSTTAYGVLA